MEKKKKLTVSDFLRMKQEGRRLTMLTAYDFPTAVLLERCGVDILLVGDSLGNVILGYESTLPVTMEEMLHHTRAVRRGSRTSFLVTDMPFMSYQISFELTIANAGRFLKEAGADAVKLEGGDENSLSMTNALTRIGIPVMGHLGLTPQTASLGEGMKVRGKERESAQRIMEQARKLEQAGCFSLVLECVPDRLAALVTSRLKIPVIGIGAGPGCDGQVLVTPDMLGLTQSRVPRFVKQYANFSETAVTAIDAYIREVREGSFPAGEHSFHMSDEDLRHLEALD